MSHLCNVTKNYWHLRAWSIMTHLQHLLNSAGQTRTIKQINDSQYAVTREVTMAAANSKITANSLLMFNNDTICTLSLYFGPRIWTVQTFPLHRRNIPAYKIHLSLEMPDDNNIGNHLIWRKTIWIYFKHYKLNIFQSKCHCSPNFGLLPKRSRPTDGISSGVMAILLPYNDKLLATAVSF